MRSYRRYWTGPALVLTLGACSADDLTLPGGNQPPSPVPAVLKVVSGDGQRGEPGATLGEPLTVRVVDDSARPVPGTPIHFGFLGDIPGATLDPASVLTDSAGRAAAVVRLGTVVGEQMVVAEVASTAGPNLRATFTATAVAPKGGGGGRKGQGSGNRGGSDDSGDD